MKKILFVFLLSAIGFAAGAQSLAEGIKHMDNENYAQALHIFNSICKSDPKNTVACYLIGEVHYLTEDYVEAEKAYRRGLSNNSQCAECYTGLGKLELDKGNTAEAEKNFSTALRINKKSAALFAQIGDAYLYGKKPNAAKAIEYLSTARDMDPKSAIYWAHLGEAYQMTGNMGEAMTAYERAVEKDPNNAEAYIRMARIWARAQQEELAIQKLQEAMRLSPDDARPIKDLYELYIRERRYDKVIPLLEKYVTLIGNDVDAKVRLVKFLTFQAKDYDRAIEEGEKLIKHHPDQYTLHRWLSWAYASKAKEMEGGRTPSKTMDPAVAELYQKAYDHSRKLFESLRKDTKRQAYSEDYEFWALSALKVGKVDTAAHVYRKYIEFEPSKAPDIYATLARTYYDSANYAQAIAYYNRKMEQKPLTIGDEYYLGLSYMKQNDLVQADSSFARVLVLNPGYAYGWWMRGQIASMQDTEPPTTYLAKPYIEKYIELADPASNESTKSSVIKAYYYMAYWALQNNQNSLALEYYEKILALDPENKDVADTIKLIKSQR